MNEKDFNVSYDSFSYMILYKGKSIGGAGVLDRTKRKSSKQAQDNLQSGKREIKSILQGRANKMYMDNIRKIDSEITE